MYKKIPSSDNALIRHKRLLCLLSAFLVILTGLSLSVAAADLRSEQAALRDLQKTISTVQKQIRKDSRDRDRNLLTLEKIDKDIAEKRAKVRNLTLSMARAELDINSIEKEKQQALDDLSIEQKQLAALIQLAYRQDGASLLKWLLDMENPSELARTKTYYRYLMQEQKNSMTSVSEEVMSFAQLLAKAHTAKEKIVKLKQKNDAAIETLNADRRTRNDLVKQLNQNIATQQSEVQQLQQQEAALLKVISELEAALADFPTDPQQSFRSLKGNLAWPLKGKVLNVYGNYRIPKQGLRWQGLQIQAERNTEIRAVAYGRIVYADWLPGMGLLTIIDHGNGYLSLYGNCEMLFKEIGTWVNAGEVIALVGDSGGSNHVGLYLEFRKGKRPFNPQSWFKRRRP